MYQDRAKNRLLHRKVFNMGYKYTEVLLGK